MKTNGNIHPKSTRNTHRTRPQVVSNRTRLRHHEVQPQITPNPKTSIAILHHALEPRRLIRRNPKPVLGVDSLPVGGSMLPHNQFSGGLSKQPFPGASQAFEPRGIPPSQPGRTGQTRPGSTVRVQRKQNAGIGHSEPSSSRRRKRRQIPRRQAVARGEDINNKCLRVQDGGSSIHRKPQAFGSRPEVTDRMLLHLTPHRVEPAIEGGNGP